MDSFGRLLQSSACAADGTSSTSSANPLTRVIDSVLRSGAVNATLDAAFVGSSSATTETYRHFPHHIQQQNNQQRMIMENVFQEQQDIHHHHQIQTQEFYQRQQQLEEGGDTTASSWAEDFHRRGQIANAPETRIKSQYPPSVGLVEAAGRVPMYHHDNRGISYFPMQSRALLTPRFNQAYHRSEQEMLHLNEVQKNSPCFQSESTDPYDVTNAVVKAMESNPDPRWQNSEFLEMMQKVRDRKVTFEDNAVVSHEKKDESEFDSAWTGFDNSTWESKPVSSTEIGTSENDLKQQDDTRGRWNDAFEDVWNSPDLDENALESIWGKALNDAKIQHRTENATGSSNETNILPSFLPSSTYTFATNNQYLQSSECFEEGMRLFAAGQLAEAILAFEAAVQQNADHSEAWRLLGECHAENDEDKKAIACLERSVEQDAYNLNALLSLGVSYVNEMDYGRALHTLKAWVKNNPKFHGLEIKLDNYSDGSLMDEVMNLMMQAETFDSSDADVQIVLGVLYNVSRDYDAAAKSFMSTVETRPDDYTLWNKLGATLANNNQSLEAIPLYHKALELKPKYARGWLNLGVSHANSGQYHEASRCYLQALTLNPKARHIWSYLRISFTCLDRFDLVKLTDTQDLSCFKSEFQLIDL